MALEVIGAGMGRTGTHSLKLALEMLGLGPCHHMSEVISRPEQKAMWRAVARGENPGWDTIYEDYRSAVDWPTAHYWRELSAYYPEARVILSVRDPEKWHQSVVSTIARTMGPDSDPETFGTSVIAKQIFGGRIDDRDHAIAIHNAHNAAVRAELPPDRLLVFEAAQGWEPLCAFLGVDVPDEPYPHSNTTGDFQARMQQRR